MLLSYIYSEYIVIPMFMYVLATLGVSMVHCSAGTQLISPETQNLFIPSLSGHCIHFLCFINNESDVVLLQIIMLYQLVGSYLSIY